MKPQENSSSAKASTKVSTTKAISNTPKAHIKKLNTATQSDPIDRNGGCIPQGV
jgi:hypothetical protein